MPQLKIEPILTHTDARGGLIKLQPEPVTGEVYAVRTRPNESRGHHYHKKMGEWFTAIQGEGVVVVLDPVTLERSEASLVNQRVYVPAGMAHAIFNTGPDELVVIASAEAPHDPEDVVRFPVSRT